ncbi:MAG: hypothetical protein ACKO38_07405 [Planctomycetota bacterium]
MRLMRSVAVNLPATRPETLDELFDMTARMGTFPRANGTDRSRTKIELKPYIISVDSGRSTVARNGPEGVAGAGILANLKGSGKILRIPR